MAKRTTNRANVPNHIAIIPDGNRRWSSSNKFGLMEGYSKGINKFMDVCQWTKDFGVKTLTVWALSTDNIKNRTKTELSILYGIYVRFAEDPKNLEKLLRNNVRIKIIGNLHLLPKRVKDALKGLESKTAACRDLTINLLVGYGGRDDILHAVRKVYGQMASGKSGKVITEEMLNNGMITSSIPDVDLIIRTSWEMRLSGFLPWQSDYSELYFAKKYWPDFGREDLRKALREFSERQRRYGR